MRKLIYILPTLLFAPYICAYAIAHIFKMKDREDMPTVKEWFALED